MVDPGFRHALAPLPLGARTLRNRIVSTAHQTGLVHDHLPTDDLVAYHRERARGGIGAIFLEASAVHPSGLLTPHTIGAYLPEAVPALARVADAVHEEGAALLVQLFHGGREQIAIAPKAPAVAPSAVPTTRFHVEPRALTRREIAGLVAGYGLAARHVTEAGLDGIEVSAAHAYLPAQFLASRSNVRTDEYNGDLRARLRFLVEALSAVHDNTDRPVGVRLALDEISPDGLTKDTCLDVAATLCELVSLDFVSFALGDSATYRGSAYIAPAPPVARNVVLDLLAGVRDAVPAGVAVLATTRVLELADADRAIADGLTDLVGMTRAHIADPHLVRKAVAGERAIPCIGCNQACIGHYHAGVPIGCVMNVRTGREAHLPQPRPSRAPRRTLVVGGGPAGVAAAHAAATAGHDVALVEREPELGGQLRLAGRAPGHRETWLRWQEWATAELKRLGVDVRLGVTAGPGDGVDEFDHVVVATGAHPHRPPLPAGFAVVDAWTALADPGAVPGPVLVADWGGEPTGLDVAEVLAAAGTAVTLAYSAPAPGEQIHQYQRNGYLARLDAAGVDLLPHLELAECSGDLVLRNVFSGRTRPIDDGIRTVVVAHGREPETALWAELEPDPRVELVGDAAGPRGLEEATLEGTMAISRVIADRPDRVRVPDTAAPGQEQNRTDVVAAGRPPTSAVSSTGDGLQKL
ncbi:oxidoreductase [Pseudonocardia nigra]|uniref:oxidoreductase n=1 Tax=Pseudonocardia nigra TaxID=1921578 RepID=UPI001C5F64DD|nr:FAD-dependent oxidoreductase [Pseudonocardia nigra]